MLPLGAEDPRMIGEFRLHARLGAGGMGQVFLGSSPGGRAVAVKVVHPHLARDTAFTGRFRREVAAALVVNGGYAAPVIAAGPSPISPKRILVIIRARRPGISGAEYRRQRLR